MAKNDFKPFAIGANANVTSQSDYEALPALSTGFASGKASSSQVNKAVRQASFIASALAQFVSNKTGQDILDDGDVTSFIAKMSAGFSADYLRRDNNFSEISAAGAPNQAACRTNLALGNSATLNVGTGAGTVAAGNDSRITGAAQKANNLSDLSNAATARANLGLSNVALKTDVYLSNNNLSELASAGAASQTAARLNLGNVPVKNEVYLSNNNLSEISAAGSAPQAAARSNLGLGTTATRNIGTGSNQVPDMGAFPAGLGSAGALGATGYQRLPGGYIRQWGTAVADSNGDVSITFPIAFSVKPDAVYFGCRQSGVPTAIQSIIINDPLSDNTRVVCRAYKIDGSLTITGSTSAFYWVAEGKV